MATDPESKQAPILIAMQAGIDDPCMISAIAHVKSSTLGDALEHEATVLFGLPEAPPAAPPEAQA